MTWVTHYAPPEQSHWQGRSDIPPQSCFFQIVHALDIRNAIPAMDRPAFALLGFCCDEGIKRNFGRVGAAQGPKALRQSLAKLPLPAQDILFYDVGDITCSDDDLESAQTALGEAVALLLKANITPLIIGGGHELAWGHYQGIHKMYPNTQLGIVNFDAHFDMRPLLPNQTGSSGTPFLQIANTHNENNKRFDYNCMGIQRTGNIPFLFETAKKHQVNVVYAEELFHSERNLHEWVNRIINENQHVYLSLCLDVFAAPYAPGVSAPQSLGITPWQIIPFVRQIAASGKALSYDIAELSPPYDLDNRTAKLASHFIYEIIHYHSNKRM